MKKIETDTTNTATAQALTTPLGSRPVMIKSKGWSFEVENADGKCVWANTGLGNGERAPECLASKNRSTAYFHRQEVTTLIYRIPSENGGAF